ncbi:MAG: hypothetical protein H6907_18115 [Hyphomicrobiales bacterium]|nr:hypothetical protein [Hyphomicrobiales bacterium]MCP5373650.1 hypothetical protein [Hyphomicrobiales bacterium]
MPTIRPELAQDIRVFYVTAQGYAADHWYGWLPKVFNMHPEIFALLAHEGSRPKYLKERTRGERPDIVAFTHFLSDMGMTYEAIGDFYSYRGWQIPPLRDAFGDAVPVVNIVRHPIAWLEFYVRWRSSNMRMPDGSLGPIEWEWGIAHHELFKELGLKPYGQDEPHIWAAYQGMHMMNDILRDSTGRVTHVKLESLVRDPDHLQRLVSFLTKGRCTFPQGILDAAYAIVDTPFRGEEKLRVVPRELYDAWPDWKKEALAKLLKPDARALYERFGYRLSW